MMSLPLGRENPKADWPQSWLLIQSGFGQQIWQRVNQSGTEGKR